MNLAVAQIHDDRDFFQIKKRVDGFCFLDP